MYSCVAAPNERGESCHSHVRRLYFAPVTPRPPVLDVSRVLSAIDTLFTTLNKRPTVEQVALALGVAPVYLRRQLRQTRSPSPHALISQVCLTRAAALVVDGMKIEAALTLAGFNHHTNFNRQFRKRFGMNPAEYRQQAQTKE